MMKKYFIPHEDNDFRPHFLQQAAVVGMLALVLITFTVANLQSSFWVTSDWLVSTVLPAVIVTETNEERVEESLLPLERNSVLDEAAEQKAEDMAARSYFAHRSPDGHSPWYWLEASDYDFAYAGENLAVHFTDSTAVVEAWMQSPTHKDNILNANYRQIGIGTAKGRYEGFDTVFVVQLFATPTGNLEAVSLSEDQATGENELLNQDNSSIQSGSVAGASTEESVPEVALTEEGTVVYSSFASTTNEEETAKEEKTEDNARNLEGMSSGGPSEPPAANLAAGDSGGSWLSVFSLATKPQTVLQITYMTIGLMVLAALMLSIAIEIRRQHPAQIAYGTSLIAVMLLLFYVHLSVAGGVIIA